MSISIFFLIFGMKSLYVEGLTTFCLYGSLVNGSKMQPKKLLRATQRLVGFSILHQTYSSQKSSFNPFISFIVNVSMLPYDLSKHAILEFLLFISFD